ncbi:MAG: hypothetical protein ABI275_07035 [Terrimesophilobacter sp.]
MSAASSLATRAVEADEVQLQPRHIEIVSTRSQRRARPRMVYAAVTIAGLFAILIAQLLLSIAVSDGAYQIAALQGVQRELSRDQQTLTEQLHVLQSPQHLAANAQALGMVANTGTAFLRLADGAVIGTPVAATASGGSVIGADGALLVPDSLLKDLPLAAQPAVTDQAAVIGQATAGQSAASDAVVGAPAGAAAAGSVASAPIPAPITR